LQFIIPCFRCFFVLGKFVIWKAMRWIFSSASWRWRCTRRSHCRVS